MVIKKSNNMGAMKNIFDSSLSVYYRNEKRICMPGELFEELFDQPFVPCTIVLYFALATQLAFHLNGNNLSSKICFMFS